MISVIIPALNEESGIGATLLALANQPDYEVIVVDGGSTDSTVAIARQHGALVVSAGRGRGVQMAAGANSARGDVFWFVHADTLPPPMCLACIRDVLERDSSIAGGHFSLLFDGESRGARWLTRIYPHLRKIGLCYGDSGIFVRRAVYEQIGGFQPYPLFEDLDIIRRIRRAGRFVHLDERIVTSSRRFENRNFELMFAQWSAMQVLFWLGVSPHVLAKAYAHVRRPQSDAAQKRTIESK